MVSIVFYYGEEIWDRAVELYDMLDFNEISDEVKPLIQNYRINLVDIHDVEDTSRFTTDLGMMIDLMKIRKDRNQLEKYIRSHADFFEKTTGDVYDMVAELINSQWLINEKKKYLDEERGRFNMCTGMREWLEEVRTEGEYIGFEKGESSGFAKGLKSGISISLGIIRDVKNGQSPETVAEKYQIDINEVLGVVNCMSEINF